MEFALPTDSTEASGLSLLRRLWVARFDVEEEGRALAEKYVNLILKSRYNTSLTLLFK